MEYKRYEVGGKIFYQRPITVLQERYVEELIFQSLSDAPAIADFQSFLKAVGPHKATLMAIVLIPEEQTIDEFVVELERPGFVERQEKWFGMESSPGLRMQVIADFFVSSQIGLYAESLINLTAWLTDTLPKLPGGPQKTASISSAPPLPAAALADAGPSTA
ncbi:MAG: hypothetical protein AB7T38_02440 [Nitrospirales bacterium]